MAEGDNGFMLEGYRTYIIAVLIVIAAVLARLDWISRDDMNLIISILLGGGLATLRMGQKDETKKLERKL